MTRMRTTAALVGAMLALVALPAAADAAVRVSFGSTLSEPPTDFEPPATCDTTGTNADTGPCTRVALGFAATGAIHGHVRAPLSGTIRRVRIRAGTPGTVRLVLVRLGSLDRDGGRGDGRATTRSPLLRLQGRGMTAAESFDVSMRARTGDYLAIEGPSTSALRCVGGDSEQILFSPPLMPGDPMQPSSGYDDCTLLVQARVTVPQRKRKRSRSRRR